MKVLSTEGLTKLIQLIKGTFIPASDTVSASTVTLADVATSGDIGDLTNVTLTTPTSGQVLSYDGSKWVNSSTGAGVTDVEVNGTSVVSGGVASVSVPTQASDINALPDSTKYGADLSYSSNTLQLLDQDGSNLGSSVSLPDPSLKANTGLDNLSETGKKVIDGQWVSSQITMAQSATIAASTDIEYDISSYLPNDNYNYEVLFSLCVSTGSTSGDGLEVGVCSDNVYSMIRSITAITRTNSSNNGACAYTIPVGTGRKLIIRNISSGAGTIRFFRTHAYRRIGTNS